MAIIRKILERLSRGVILRRKLQKDFGRRPIFVTPESGLRYWRYDLSKIDTMLYHTAKNFISEGDNIWDIGANVGLFGVMAASISKKGRCIFFEPDIWLCNLIKRTTAHNIDLKFDILPLAVANQTNLVSFNIAKRSRATNFIAALGSSQTGGVRESYLVPAINLDSLAASLPKPDFIKIDTEGAEILILQGAVETLKGKPKILIEVTNESYEEVVNILSHLHYNIYDANKLPELVLTNINISGNLLAIPQ